MYIMYIYVYIVDYMCICLYVSIYIHMYIYIEQGTRSFMVQVIQGSTTEKICSGMVSTNACFFDVL